MSDYREELSHLNLLKIFHYIYGGIGVLAAGGICLFQGVIFSIITGVAGHEGEQEVQVIGGIILIVVLFICGIGLLGSISNLLSGKYLGERRNRTFSIVIACINCLNMPLGTALGIFTLITLTKKSVCELYDENEGRKTRPDYLD